MTYWSETLHLLLARFNEYNIESPGIGLAIIIITLKCCHESEPFLSATRVNTVRLCWVRAQSTSVHFTSREICSCSRRSRDRALDRWNFFYLWLIPSFPFLAIWRHGDLLCLFLKKTHTSVYMRSSFNVDGRDCISLACNQLPWSFLIALCWFPTCERRNVLVSRVSSLGFILALLYRLLELNSFKYSS